MKYILLSISLMLFSHNLLATDLEKFTRQMENEQVKISPDGKHLAVRTIHEGQYVLAFLETNSKKLVFTLNMKGKQSVGEYYWVNNERVVISVLTTHGAIKQTYRTGKLFAINIDGSNPRSMRDREGYKQILSPLSGDDKHILVAIYPWRRAAHLENRRAFVLKMNVYDRWSTSYRVANAAGRGGEFIIDNNNDVRFSLGEDGYDEYTLYYREPDGEWQGFEPKLDYTSLSIEGFSEDNKSVYIIAYKDGDTGILYSYDLEKKIANKIYHNDFVEITTMLKNDQGVPYGIRVDEDYSNYLIFNETVDHSKLHQELYRAFKGDSVDIINSSMDGKLVIVRTSGDRNPGQFYLYNTENNSAKYLLSRADWIKPSDLGVVEPFKFTTRDKLTLNGYLTLPNNKGDKNIPLVVMPHGGPRARDYWGYDSNSQQLAASGYAVLQVNFRGSSGFGEKRMHMGDNNWGSKVQFDIIDATKWAIKSGVADPKRICIYGGSFGAYSALQSSIIEPDLFKCTIGASGVYDLNMMRDEGDIPDGLWGMDYLDEAVGTNDEVLKLNSPVNLVNKLKAPVLLIHGSADERTPIDQAEALEEALEDKGHSFKTLYVDNEYHGFVKHENRIKASEAIIEFLNEHIGK